MEPERSDWHKPIVVVVACLVFWLFVFMRQGGCEASRPTVLLPAENQDRDK
jgi:hypothetical protein